LSGNVPAVAYTSIIGIAESFRLWRSHQHLAAHRGDGIRIMTAPAAGSGAVNVRIPRRRRAGEHDA
jgi:hypothetical protein